MFGLLNLNKPAGCTSRDIVTKISRIVGRKVKVGHAGTLDPLARGVLVVCVGPATRLVSLIHEHLKSYEATFLLGQSSETDDVEGELQSVEIPASVTAEALRAALPEFTGKIQQVPPIYSAVKVDGQRAYRVARRGEAVELSAREVTVTRLEMKEFSKSQFSLSIDCGTGTYIRSIGRDLARRLGTEAVMSKLIRTRVGPFTVENACEIETLNRTNLQDSLISPLTMLDHLPRIVVTPEQAIKLGQGQSLAWPEDQSRCDPSGQMLAIVNEQYALIAIAVERQGRIAPQMVLRVKE